MGKGDGGGWKWRKRSDSWRYRNVGKKGGKRKGEENEEWEGIWGENSLWEKERGWVR